MQAPKSLVFTAFLIRNNHMVAGNIKENEFIDGALTILLCGTNTYSIDAAAAKYEELYNADVNIMRYYV